VRDTGTGIPAEELPHIFERFHRVKGARGRSYEGSGIGLALVQELVKLHSGTIQVNSVVDQGTCFTVAIPMGFAHLPSECIGATRTLASTATGASPYIEEMLRWSSKSIESSDALASELSISIPVQPQSSSAPTARILLADDNADMRDYLKRLLSQQYEVEAVADGIAALTAIRQQRPDLVLTDVMMPQMDGFELLRLLRNPPLEDSLQSDPTTQDIPIILLSARAGEEARIEGLAAGADDYLTKPFSARELLARVEANLKLAQLRREATQREQALRLAAESAQQNVETILSSISDAFVVLDQDCRFTYVNDRYCEIVDTEREALIGQIVWELFPEAADSEAERQFERALSQQTPVEFEWLFPAWNRWFEFRVYPSPDGLTIFLREISDRKQAEAALHQREAQFRQLADAMPQIVWIADAEGNPDYVSQRWVDYTGLTLEQTVERNWINQVIHPDDLEPTYEIWRTCLATGTLYQTEFRLRQAFAEQSEDVYRWFLCRAVPIHNPQGEITHWYGTLTDLHDRKQIETVLRESEERLQLAVEAGRMLAWEWNPSADTLITSSNFPEIYGRPEIQSGEQGFALVHPDDRTRHQMTVETTVATGNNYQSEFRCIRPDNGAIIWLEERGQAILNSDGSLQKLIGITIDVTERKQAEEDLRLNRDRLAFVLDNTGIGLWLNSLPLNDLNWDNRTREFFFVPPEVEPTAELFWSRLHPDDREPTRLAIEAALRDRTLYQIDHRAVNPDTGEIRWIRSAGKAIYAPDGSPIRFDGINYDITDRKQAEAEREQLLRQEQTLRQQAEIAERRLYALLESIRENFVLFDRDWHVVYLNSQAATTMQKSRDEILGRCHWDLFPDLVGTEFYDRLHQAMREQTPVQFEYYYDTWDTWFENRVYPAYEGITVLCTNITDRKQAEAEREQLLAREQAAREAAEAASHIKDEFLAVVSHELRSPLNPILGWSKLLRSRQLDAQKTDRALEVIERNAQMQAQLINDLLDVSRILRGKLSLDTNPVDLVVTIQAAMETVRLAAEAKSIQIHTQFEPDVGQVAGDGGRLQQVIWNLLTNAVKFTSPGGRVDIRLERIDSQAQITVTDTGKGIPSDFLPYVFEQFRQESAATTRRFGGLGLGLAIVRYLVELHGGTIQADSPGEGQGATFTVKLPLMPHQPIKQPDPKPSECSLDLQGTRILVVDDDDNTREFLAFLLELHGANVMATATASEALTTLTQFKPEALLSDIGMPDMDGYMLVRQVRALPAEQGGTIPAIALTAYAGEIDYQQAMAAGFQQHIAKPIEPQVLIQAIASLLGMRIK